MKFKIETPRLILREYLPEDFDALYAIFSDAKTMEHYPHPFCRAEAAAWMERNRERYGIFGFGLWAVTLRQTGEVIGDCGLTMQNIGGSIKPEIGYHINRNYWRRGYGSEAARACRDWAFQNTPFERLYSCMKFTNEGSYCTARANGMHQVDEFADDINTRTRVFAIARKEWE